MTTRRVVNGEQVINQGRDEMAGTPMPTIAAADAGIRSPSSFANDLLDAAYRVHRDSLYRYAFGMTRNAADAEELVQEVFLRLVTELGRDRTPDQTGAWLFRVAANLAASQGRRAAVRGRPRALVAVRAPEQPDELAIQRERTRAIEAAIADLPAHRRDVVVLAAYGYQGAQLAKRLGRTERAARVLLCRTRRRLRENPTLAEWASQ
jgi:RNA polymerase sigma-70 factor (ECF subfamily)